LPTPSPQTPDPKRQTLPRTSHAPPSGANTETGSPYPARAPSAPSRREASHPTLSPPAPKPSALHPTPQPETRPSPPNPEPPTPNRPHTRG
ncbi:hypothetical protein T484DRAFT_1635844, partial [Baffinella frigidus]